jgi:chloride channel, nucleotide-sensitive, 1A
MEVISEAPQATSFVPLLEHQAATPASFYTGPPVLHYYNERCKVIILDSEASKSPALQRLAQGSEKKSTTTNGHSSEGEPDEAHVPEHETSAQCIIEDIEVWVTSEYVF